MLFCDGIVSTLFHSLVYWTVEELLKENLKLYKLFSDSEKWK